MNLDELGSRVDSNRRDAARVNRTAASANPEFDAGMDDGFDDFDDDADFGFGQPASGGFGDQSAGGFGQPAAMGTPTAGFGLNSFGASPQPVEAPKSAEDKAYEVAAQVGKQSLNLFKDLIESFHSFDAVKKSTTGRYTLVMSIILVVIGALLMIFNRFQLGLEILVGSLISCGFGIVLLCFGQSEVSSMPDTSAPAAPEPNTFVDDFGWGNNTDTSSSDFDDSGFEDEDEDEFAVDDDDTAVDDSGFGSDTSWDLPSGDTVPTEIQHLDIDTARAQLDNLPSNGLIDRRSLFEHAMSVLANITPTYATPNVIAEGTPLFDTLDALVQDSAEVIKTGNSDEHPYLISAVDTLFYIRLEIQRVKFIKNVDQFTQEIVNIFQYDKNTGKRDLKIYGTGEFVGDKIYIKLMKGEGVTVALRDIYKTNEKDILDMGNKMPIVMGIDIEGAPVIKDFAKLNSMLITGAPRTGKSWLLQALMWQMMLYYSPNDLWFYFMDPKAGISDFTSAITPHVKKFVTADDNIVAQLKHIVHVEGPRRKALIGDADCVNLDDYRKKFPSCNIPYIYIMIDEVVTLADRMDAEVKKEFQGLLSELVSQLPATGIRLFMVPHLVKDNIIKKNVTSLIPCRVSVMGDAEHIESSCGVKNFPHVLSNLGDTCTKLMGDPKPMFVHGVVLSNSNEDNKRLFNYLGDLWARVAPDSVAGSVYERKQKGLPLFEDDIASNTTSVNTSARSVGNPRVSIQSAPTQSADVTRFMQETGISSHQRDNNILNNPVNSVDLWEDE